MAKQENKYYTPSIEDIHIGYECELFYDNKWNSLKIIRQYDLEYDWESMIYNKTIRTPYLTREQIEQQGWEETAITRDGGTILFSKKIDKQTWYELKYGQSNKMHPTTNIIITLKEFDPGWYGSGDTLDSKVIFNGNCQSINDLRTIQSLLNIK